MSGGNQGQVFLMLKPRDQRALSADQVLQELQPKLLSVPGILAFLQNPPPITIGGNNTQSPYQLTLQGADQNEIYHWAPILMDRIRTLPRLHECDQRSADRQSAGDVDIDRDRAQTFGVTPDQIQNALFTAYGTRQASTIYTPSNEYQVILEVEPQYQRNPDALSKLYVRSAKGTLVPLDSRGEGAAHGGPAFGESLRPAAGRHDFVQSAARLCAGRCGRGHRRRDPGAAHPAHASRRSIRARCRLSSSPSGDCRSC